MSMFRARLIVVDDVFALQDGLLLSGAPRPIWAKYFTRLIPLLA
jgi:hypothetical protein